MLQRIAIPKEMREIEDLDVFSGCNSLKDISFGGSRESFEVLTRGNAITVTKSDLTVFTPTVAFMNLDK